MTNTCTGMTPSKRPRYRYVQWRPFGPPSEDLYMRTLCVKQKVFRGWPDSPSEYIPCTFYCFLDNNKAVVKTNRGDLITSRKNLYLRFLNDPE